MEPGRFAEVLEAAKAADADAVSILWRRYNPSLVTFLRVRCRHHADDIASETWIRAGRTLRRFEGSERDFRAWLFTIARRALIDWQRQQVRLRSVPVDDAVFDELRGDADPATTAIDRVDATAALSLLALLPPDQAEVVVLRVITGLDVASVAEVTGKTSGHVRVLQHRALARLARLLESSTEKVATP